LDRSRDTFVHAQTVVGSIQNRSEATGENLASTEVELTKRQSAVEDVDLAKAASELSERQQVYQASLQVAAKIIQPSLLQFL
jgi:flagellar hook-associated protein 3 FlgL